MAAYANERSKALFKRSLVWDMTLPWLANFSDDITLPRFAAAGINFISLTVAGDSVGPELALKQIGWVRNYVARQPDKFVLVQTVDDILAAQANGKLAFSHAAPSGVHNSRPQSTVSAAPVSADFVKIFLMADAPFITCL